MRKHTINKFFLASLFLLISLLAVGKVHAEEIGNSIFQYNQDTVIIKESEGIPYELKGYGTKYLEPKKRGVDGLQYNGQKMNTAKPGKTSNVWPNAYYINKDDVISYETIKGSEISITAKTPIPDFVVYDSQNEIYGIQGVFGSFLDYLYPKIKVNISSTEKTKGHITLKDIDYGENITINKSSLRYIGVSENSKITYEETDSTITFYGKQGTKGASGTDDNYWITLFLDSNSIDLELKTSAGTITGFSSENVVALPDDKQSVTAHYVDTEGNAISDNVVKTGNIGDTYSTEQKTIPGYTFKEVQGSASGQFTDQEQTVTYVYTKDPVAGGNVTVKYVDGAGNTISDNVVKSGNIGDDYSTDQKAIPGYTFKEVQGSASGQFTDQEQTVTYIYTKNSLTPVKPTEPGTTQTNENNTETPVKNTTNVSLHNSVTTLGSVSTTNEKSLPTTGEKPANWAVVVGGLITLTAATVLYLLKRK